MPPPSNMAQDQIKICLVTGSPVPDIHNAEGLEMEQKEAVYLAGLWRALGLEVTVRSLKQTVGDLDQTNTPYDAVVIRDLGALGLVQPELERLAERAYHLKDSVVFYNPPDSHYGYQDGKTYLPLLSANGWDVIPTTLSKDTVSWLGRQEHYVLKSLIGCSYSCPPRLVAANEIETEDTTECIIQPLVGFKSEVSFFFIDGEFQGALTAAHSDTKNPSLQEHLDKRWDGMSLWEAKPKQVEWAKKFVDYLSLPYGLVRVDAALMPKNKLLLMEMVAKSPYLSILPEEGNVWGDRRDSLVQTFADSVIKQVQSMRNSASYQPR